MHPSDLLSKHFRLHDLERQGLAKLGLKTVHDLLYYFPARYGDSADSKRIAEITIGEVATVFGKITQLKTGKAYVKKISMAEGTIEDETGKIKAVWFNQPYIAKMIKEDSLVRIEGKVSDRKGELYMSNPKIEVVADIPLNIGNSLFGSDGEIHTLYPVYPETRGITTNWIYHKVQKILNMPRVFPKNTP